MPTLPTVRRGFQISNETWSGGASYNDISGSIPTGSTYWAVTGGTFDANVTTIDRSPEVRGIRATTSPLSFRSQPVLTVPMPVYLNTFEKAIYRALGTFTTSGSAGSGFTHTFAPMPFGNTPLPTATISLTRDDLVHNITGCSANRVTLNFPLDDQGTIETEFYGEYVQVTGSSALTPSFTGQSTIMMLRDATMTMFDGTTASVNDLQAFSLTFNNNLIPKFYAGTNVESRTLGTGSAPYFQTNKIWWPEFNKMGAAADINFSVTFGNTVQAEELAMMYAQVRKMTFTVTGASLATTPVVSETITITIYNGVYTGGGADALSARDDIVSNFDGGVFMTSAQTKDLEISVVTLTTAANITGSMA